MWQGIKLQNFKNIVCGRADNFSFKIPNYIPTNTYQFVPILKKLSSDTHELLGIDVNVNRAGDNVSLNGTIKSVKSGVINVIGHNKVPGGFSSKIPIGGYFNSINIRYSSESSNGRPNFYEPSASLRFLYKGKWINAGLSVLDKAEGSLFFRVRGDGIYASNIEFMENFLGAKRIGTQGSYVDFSSDLSWFSHPDLAEAELSVVYVSSAMTKQSNVFVTGESFNSETLQLNNDNVKLEYEVVTVATYNS